MDDIDRMEDTFRIDLSPGDENEVDPARRRFGLCNLNVFIQLFARNSIYYEYNRKTTLERKARFLWKVENVEYFVPHFLYDGNKVMKFGINAMGEAHVLSESGEHEKAVGAQTRCIANMNQARFLRVALENRSKILEKMGRTEQARQDYNLGYEIVFHEALREAREKNLVPMADGSVGPAGGNLEEKRRHLRELERRFELAAGGPIARKKWAAEYCKYLHYIHAEKLVGNMSVPHYNIPAMIATANSPQQPLRGFSDIKWTEDKGRHLIATTFIPPGTLLHEEKPVVAAPDTKLQFTNCHHCMRRSLNLIPCKNCAVAVFCSDECLTLSEIYHQWECGEIGAISVDDMFKFNVAAVRPLTQNSWTEIKALGQPLRNLLEHPPRSSIPNGIWDNHSLMAFYNHQSNVKLDDPWKDYCRMISCLYVVKCLENKGYFPGGLPLDDGSSESGTDVEHDSDATTVDGYEGFPDSIDSQDDSYNEYRPPTVTSGARTPRSDRALAAMMIYRAWAILDLNAFSVFDIILDKPTNVTEHEPVRLGTACYNVASFINHSCAPNCYVIFDGTKLMLKAANFIEKGDELTIAYIQTFLTASTSERKRQLKEQYHFMCKCVACTNVWPTLHILSLMENQTRSHCPLCSIKLPIQPPEPPLCLNCKNELVSFYAQLRGKRRQHKFSFNLLTKTELKDYPGMARACELAAIEYLSFARMTYKEPHFEYYDILNDYYKILNVLGPVLIPIKKPFED